MVPIPIRLFKASIDKVLLSKFRASVTFAKVNVDADAAVIFKAPDEFRVTTPLPCPRFVVPVEDRLVKAPVEAVLAPTAVELIPVAVVLKLPEVNKILFAPKFIDEEPSPDNVKAPDPAVKLSAPVVRVNPFEAVNSPADVIVPVPVAEILPDVVIASPELLGESVVPVLFQKPNTPDVGAVEVRPLVPFV